MNSMLLVWFGEQRALPNYNQTKSKRLNHLKTETSQSTITFYL